MPRGKLQLNGRIARHCTLQPSDRVLRRMAITWLHHAGCAISIMIAVIPSGGRARSRNVLSASTWFTAPSASITVASCGVLRGGQTELEPPAEQLAGDDAMRRKTAATRNARLFRHLYHRLLLLVGEALTVRPPVRSFAMSSDTYSAQLAALLNCARALRRSRERQPISLPACSRRSRQNAQRMR